MSRYRVLADSKLTVLLPGARKGQPEAVYRTFRKTDLGTIYNYVDDGLKPKTLSVSPQTLSLAEQLFGFVIKNKKEQGAAFAGRVRPSIGTLMPGQTDLFDDRGDFRFNGADEPWVRLKELSEPMKTWVDKTTNEATGKTIETDYTSATQNFYFREKNNDSQAHISKSDFAIGKSGTYETQGQKAYLHHTPHDSPDAQPWRTAASIAADQKPEGNKGPAAPRKTLVRPLNKGVKFQFTFDFDNLTEAMLNLLCFALRPSPAFRHKIGYGKPLGLGSVRIDPTKIEFVDRKARYSTDALDGSRNNSREDLQAIQARAQEHSTFLKKKHPDSHKALLLIGETHNFLVVGLSASPEMVPVLWVPLSTEAFNSRNLAAAEKNSYGWFSKNDENSKQRLKPITKDTASLPTLKTISIPPRGDKTDGVGGNGRGQQSGGSKSAAAPAVSSGNRSNQRMDGAQGQRPSEGGKGGGRYSVTVGDKDIAGKIATLKSDRGYGFIAPDTGGQNLFFHFDRLCKGVNPNSLTESMSVRFDVEVDQKDKAKLNAIRVEPID